jgi:hypothetical protein
VEKTRIFPLASAIMPLMRGQFFGFAALIVLLGCNSSISIKPPSADVQPPNNVIVSSDQTSITAPGKLRFSLQGSDNIGIAKLELREGDTVLGQLSAPGTLELNYSSADIGSHTYTAVAFDAAQNSTASTAHTVSINAPTGAGAISFVGVGTGLEVNQGSKLELNVPSTQQDDLLIAVIAINAFSSNIVTPPNGWTTLGTNYPLQGGGSAVKTLWIFTKRASPESIASFSWVESSNARGVILAYRGVNSWLEARRVIETPSPNAVTPSLDLPSDARVLRIASLAPANHERQARAPSGLEVRYNSGPTLNLSLAIADEALPSGRTDERSFAIVDKENNSYNEPYSAMTIALR